MTHHFVMTPSLRIKISKIDKFGDFSCDIDYNSRTDDVFRDVISLIINQCDPRPPGLQGASGGRSVRQPRNASKRSACIYTTRTKVFAHFIILLAFNTKWVYS